MTPPSADEPESRRLPRRFRRLYLLALGTVALLAIVGQVLVQVVLWSQRENGQVVNQAGLQRMLSQRITLKLLLLDEADPSVRAQRVREALELSEKWRTAHAELVAAARRQAVDAAAQISLLQLLDAVEQSQQEIVAVAEAVAGGATLTPVQREAVLRDQEVFLPLMDATVREFERNGAARIAWLQRLELGLLLLTLVVLAVEAALVFRPAVARLRATLEELELKRRESSGRLKSLRDLSGGIAHHFNNLLTSIMGNAELIRFESKRDHRYSEFAEAQIEQCQRAAHMIQQLQLYAGDRHPRAEPVALGAWLRGLFHELRCGRAGVQVELQIVEDAVARVDATMLREALEGLVANACEASVGRSEGVEVRLGQRVWEANRVMAGPPNHVIPAGIYACIQVVDHGVGVGREAISRIFDPFFSQKSFGRGMGLPSILGVAHAHQGGLEVESVPGHGSTFSLYLPVTVEKPQRVKWTAPSVER